MRTPPPLSDAHRRKKMLLERRRERDGIQDAVDRVLGFDGAREGEPRRFEKTFGVLLLGAGLFGERLDDAHQIPAHRHAVIEESLQHRLDVAQGEVGRGHLFEHDGI